MQRVVQSLANTTENFEPSSYLTASSNKILNEMKLVGMSMIFYCIKLQISVTVHDFST
jgi:hypothetical protein